LLVGKKLPTSPIFITEKGTLIFSREKDGKLRLVYHLIGCCQVLLLGMASPTPPAQKLPVSPIFITEKGTLIFSHEKDGKIRLVYGNWDDAKVVEPGEVLELAGGGRADLAPPAGGSGDPP